MRCWLDMKIFGLNGILLPGLLLVLLALAGCNKAEKIDPRAGGGGLSGKWLWADNVFTAEFSGGNFIATANDTQTVISQGNYIVVSVIQVRLNWRGNVTGADNSAVCQRPEPNQLVCTDAGGKSFTLNKLSAS